MLYFLTEPPQQAFKAFTTMNFYQSQLASPFLFINQFLTKVKILSANKRQILSFLHKWCQVGSSLKQIFAIIIIAIELYGVSRSDKLHGLNVGSRMVRLEEGTRHVRSF